MRSTGGQASTSCSRPWAATRPSPRPIDCVRKGGTVTLIGNITPEVTLPLQKVVTRQIRLQGSCASAGEYPEAIDLIAGGKIKVKPLITAVAPLEDGPHWFERLYAREPNLMKVVLTPRGRNRGHAGGHDAELLRSHRPGRDRHRHQPRPRPVFRARACATPEPTLCSPAARVETLAPLRSGDRSAGPPRGLAGARCARSRRASSGWPPRPKLRSARFDILVNNAGCNVRKPALDVTWDDWNLGSRHQPARQLLCGAGGRARMVPHGYGRIINIGSVTSVAGYAGLGPYGASRGGIRQLTMSLADDWGKHGITVNCLAPGWFKTAQNRVMYEDAGVGRVPHGPHSAEAARPAPTISMARSCFSPRKPAATSPARRCWSMAASRPERCARCRASEKDSFSC